DGCLAQAAALEAEPVVESGVVYRKAVEQIAIVEFGSPAQLLDRGRGRQFLERRYVCRDGRAVKSNGIPIDGQRQRLDAATVSPQRRQRLAEAASCLDFAPVAPQETDQLLAGQLLVRMEGQIGQQGPILLAQYLHRLPRRKDGGKASHDPEM